MLAVRRRWPAALPRRLAARLPTTLPAACSGLLASPSRCPPPTPAQVPLGARYDSYIKPEDRFTPRQAKELADTAVQGRKFKEFPATVGLVIDLTNSRRYYDDRLWQELGVGYSKVGMGWRGESRRPGWGWYLSGA